MGDWKKGQKYYTMGFAYRIGTVEPDDPKKDRGGNCYACHAADPKGSCLRHHWSRPDWLRQAARQW